VPRPSTKIKRSLMTMMLLTSGAVVLLTSGAFGAYEIVTSRHQTLRNLTTLGEAIAANSTAALAFDNPDDALETLSALKAEPHLEAAGLYTAGGKLFARYPRSSSATSLPSKPPALGYRFERGSLVGVQPVMQAGRRMGTLYLRSDLGVIYAGLRSYALIAGLILLASAVVADPGTRRYRALGIREPRLFRARGERGRDRAWSLDRCVQSHAHANRAEPESAAEPADSS
jgi:hypothetical protein